MLEHQLETLEKLFPSGFVIITRTGDQTIRIAALHKEDAILKLFVYANLQFMKDIAKQGGEGDALPEIDREE